MGKKWIWVDPICVVGEFCPMGPTPCWSGPCFSVFFFAFLRLVSVRAILSHVHPSLLLSSPQALQETSPFPTGSMERRKHFFVLSLSLLHLCANFPEARKLACRSVGAASLVSAALSHRIIIWRSRMLWAGG